MDKRFNELLENVKNQILDVFPEMDRDDREEFFNRLNEIGRASCRERV